MFVQITVTEIVQVRLIFPFFYDVHQEGSVFLPHHLLMEATALMDKMAAIMVLLRLLVAILDLLFTTGLMVVAQMAATLGRLLLQIQGHR